MHANYIYILILLNGKDSYMHLNKSHSPFITEEYHKHKRERFWSVLLVSCHQHHRVGGTGGLFRSLVSEGIGLLKNLEVLHLNSKKGL